MRISAATLTVAFATLFSTVSSAPTAFTDVSPNDLQPFDIEKRQISVSVEAKVTVSAMLVSSYDQMRVHTGNINNTLGTINGDSSWVVKNNAIMSIRSELNAIGTIFATTTTQVGTLGGNLGSDLTGIANTVIAIVNELLYTLQYVVYKLGSGVLVVLGIIINNVLSILAGLILAVNILVQGSLPLVNASLNATLPTLVPALSSIILGLKYLVGY
ncbi:uncharacterized protein BKCO1_9000160 [Diplodia corticola]|uniref:Uncharacterized protein n=1 Tax=Diplodia corticola TaxID=236234 RepID=A0A1J9RW15_9PEZI|nr:uncharacterized protein BKCO1_9000160 [Diplodia corticola]OJD36811.1 hypothetical protein BKCO1_9000160 [Diplodia corticola]